MTKVGPESERQKEDEGKRCNGLIWLLGVLCLAMGIAVVILAVLLSIKTSHGNPSVKNGLPTWPEPSISPLGQYKKAAVAADNGLCSEIGRNTLIQGGSAIDAAVATVICIGVMDAHSSGLGGGHFMTVYNRTTKSCRVFDGREMAPGAAHPTMYVNSTSGSRQGWLAMGVPGELASLRTAWEAGGRRPWASLLQPTINYLTNGYPVSPALAKALRQKKSIILTEPTMSIFINEATKEVFKEGEIMKRPVLAKTLSQLANSPDPIQLFYRGSLAQTFVNEFQLNKGIITAQDLLNYKVEKRDPIYAALPNGMTVCGPPPPSSASVTAAIINYLGGYNLTPAQNLSTVPENVLTYHRLIESMKFGYAARSMMGDSSMGPGNITVPTRQRVSDTMEGVRNSLEAGIREDLNKASSVSLSVDAWTKRGMTSAYLGVKSHFYSEEFRGLKSPLLGIRRLNQPHTGEEILSCLESVIQYWGIPHSKISKLANNITSTSWAKHVRSMITDKAHKPAYYGGGFSTSDHGTSHISVLDSEGSAVSITSTINLYFGSLRRSMGTGIIWNDEMDDFSTPGVPNAFGYPPSPSNFIYPKKRPMSSMSPIVMFNRTSGQVELVVGAAGGSKIISTTAYVALRSLFFNETIKQAIDAPRLHNQLLPPVTWADTGFPQEYFDDLKKERGQNMTRHPVSSVCTGIQVKGQSIFANSDYRKGSTSFSAGY